MIEILEQLMNVLCEVPAGLSCWAAQDGSHVAIDLRPGDEEHTDEYFSIMFPETERDPVGDLVRFTASTFTEAVQMLIPYLERRKRIYFAMEASSNVMRRRAKSGARLSDGDFIITMGAIETLRAIAKLAPAEAERLFDLTRILEEHLAAC
jgi:hypothetical protein